MVRLKLVARPHDGAGRCSGGDARNNAEVPEMDVRRRFLAFRILIDNRFSEAS